METTIRSKHVASDPLMTTWSSWTEVNGTKSVYASGDKAISTSGWGMVGINTPRFHRRKNAGELIPYTPYSNYEYKHEIVCDDYERRTDDRAWGSNNWSFEVANDWDFDSLNGLMPQHIVADLDPDEALVQRAAATALSDAHDMLTSLAELRDLRRTWVSVTGRLKSIARRDWDLWGEILALPGTWLEARYGIYPLVLEMQSIAEALQAPEILRVSASANSAVLQNWTSVETFTDANHSWDISTTTTVSVGIRGSYAADYSPSRFQFNPIVTAWELTKLSFVIDWILQVGDALAVMSTTLTRGAETAAAGYFLDIERHKEVTAFRDTDPTAWISVDRPTSSSSYLKANVLYRRPTVVKTLPQMSLNINALQFVDALALMWQFFGPSSRARRARNGRYL